MPKRTTSSLSPTAARYYIQRLGTMQVEMAYTAQPTDVTTEAMTIAGITVYVKKTVVNNLAASGITPTTATVSWTGTEACSSHTHTE